MKRSDRLENLRKMIFKKGYCSINSLIGEINYSPSTLRRDLLILEKQGIIERWHGGAASIDFARLSFSSRLNINKEEKEEIGIKAANLVKDNQVVIIDAGSTASMVANNLGDKNSLTIITPAINIAKQFSPLGNFEVILTGGILKLETNSLVGYLSELSIQHVNANIAFIACDSISPNLDVMFVSFEFAKLKKVIMDSSMVKVLIVDSSKFGKISIASIGKIDLFDKVVVDSKLPNEYREKIKSCGVELII